MTSPQAADAAEDAIALYVKRCGANSPDNLRKALEMLISKAARGIEKHAGHQVAMDVLVRTVERVAENPAPASAPVGGH
jgi:hypothetical protein